MIDRTRLGGTDGHPVAEGSQKGLLKIRHPLEKRKVGTEREDSDETRPCVAFRDASQNTRVLKRQVSPDNGGPACGFRSDAFWALNSGLNY